LGSGLGVRSFKKIITKCHSELVSESKKTLK